jgi:hypothetical protein
MNNLTAERVLFAFAKGSGEDYPFRLNNPSQAAFGGPFAPGNGAATAEAACCPANRAAIKAPHRRACGTDCSVLSLKTMVSQM